MDVMGGWQHLYIQQMIMGGTQQARQLCKWARDYIADCGCLPINIYGTWNSSIFEDEDFASELLLHLQSIGKYVRAMEIVL
jgi:hypothetical protein